jgi:hypothetical protein
MTYAGDCATFYLTRVGSIVALKGVRLTFAAKDLLQGIDVSLPGR